MASRRLRGREAKQAERSATRRKASDPAWLRWRNPYRPIELFSADQIEAIHSASTEVLAETGIRVLSAEARRILAGAGATVSDDSLVRFDPDQLMELIARAPAHVTLTSRTPERTVTAGGRDVAVCTTGGTPNFSDLERGRRPGTLAALDDFSPESLFGDISKGVGKAVCGRGRLGRNRRR